MVFEETSQTLLRSDVFFRQGNPAPLTNDLSGAAALIPKRRTPSPFASLLCASPSIKQLVALAPWQIAVAYGVSFAVVPTA